MLWLLAALALIDSIYGQLDGQVGGPPNINITPNPAAGTPPPLPGGAGGAGGAGAGAGQIILLLLLPNNASALGAPGAPGAAGAAATTTAAPTGTPIQIVLKIQAGPATGSQSAGGNPPSPASANNPAAYGAAKPPPPPPPPPAASYGAIAAPQPPPKPYLGRLAASFKESETFAVECRDTFFEAGFGEVGQLCRAWAAEGECGKNPQFMMIQCAKSCGRNDCTEIRRV